MSGKKNVSATDSSNYIVIKELNAQTQCLIWIECVGPLNGDLFVSDSNSPSEKRSTSVLTQHGYDFHGNYDFPADRLRGSAAEHRDN